MAIQSFVFHRKHKRTLPTIARGEGVYLWDTTGKKYIDASGGAIVVNVGHGIAEIADAIHTQAARVGYAHATMFTSDALEQLAAKLAACLPMLDARLFFLNSGAEAIEAAIKFARQAQIARGESSRCKIISRWGSYHGATLGTLALTGKPAMRKFFEPMFLDAPHIPPCYCYRCPFGLAYPACALRCADALDDEIKRQGAHTVAAFIAEPIAGATLGAVVPPPDYFARIREICDRHGVLLIADEVMTGMGRTGNWFAMEQWNIQPDILCLGKGLASGYVALSGIAARGDLVELMWEKTGDFNHGGTFSHHPVAAAVGLATIEYIERHDLIARVQKMGVQLGAMLHATFDDHPHVGDVRGQGLLWAIELVAERAHKQPFPPEMHLATRVFERAFADGLIVYAMSGCADGIAGDHIMIAPSFVVEENQIDEIVAKLQNALDVLFTERG